jgi:hypothetical protein
MLILRFLIRSVSVSFYLFLRQIPTISNLHSADVTFSFLFYYLGGNPKK